MPDEKINHAEIRLFLCSKIFAYAIKLYTDERKYR